MVFPASQAQSLTDNTISTTSSSNVQLELTLCEQQIRTATGLGVYNLLYNAKIIGNPKGQPQISTNLTDNQEAFYTLLITNGYHVTLDTDTGRWDINWGPVGPETLVAVYSFRTTVLPGAIYNLTIDAITAFFTAQVPVMKSIAVVNGDIQESDFSGSDSVFYEYTAVVDQEYDTNDYSSGLKAHLTAQGIGYNSSNCEAYKLI
jgi:hypothetical protein